MRGFKRVLAPQVLNSVCGGFITTAANIQTPNLVNLYTGLSGASKYLMSLGDNADMCTVLQALDPATTVSGQSSTNTRRYFVDSVRSKIQLKNQTTVPITVTLYDVSARRDNGTDSFDPLLVWSAGLGDQFVNVGTTANIQGNQFPGARPFQSQAFCQRWVVKASKTFILHPGATHCHFITIRPKGLLNAELTRLNSYVKGLTTALICVIKGGVAASTAATSLVGESLARLDYVTETQYKFRAMEKSRTAMTQFNTLSGNADRTINEDQDTVITAIGTV